MRYRILTFTYWTTWLASQLITRALDAYDRRRGPA